MATTILQSRDCLGNGFGPPGAHPKPKPNPNPRINNGYRRKRSPSDRDRRSKLSSSPAAKGLVMGQVKILKRGEELNPRLFGGGLELCSTHPLGPDPQVVQKQIRFPDLYAGPTSLVSSPTPSELPFPASLLPHSRPLLNI